MRAARIHRYGAADELRIEEVPEPTPGPHDVLVEVHAASVNPIDAKIRAGFQRALVHKTFPTILGLDVAGVVAAVGAEVSRFAVGDAVFSSPTHRREGTYAEYVAIDEQQVARAPEGLSHLEAATLPLVGLTAWQCLVEAARLRRGERLFVQAGSGGVGMFAIQLGRHLGAHVATTTSARNADLVRELGAERVIDYAAERYDDVLGDYDVALESLGGEHKARARSILRRGGRLTYINTGLPPLVRRYGPHLGVAAAGLAMATFAFSSRLRGVKAKAVVRSPDGEQLAEIAQLVELGAIRPLVADVFPLADVAAAHKSLESGRTRGKIAIAVR
jgi:NADPH:quinone reductase-like Zn-dependent oxidoreductase